MTTLPELRARIDELDRELVRVVSERLAVCREVAKIKEGSETPVIQPGRVREVVTTRRQWAIDVGVDFRGLGSIRSSVLTIVRATT